MEIMKLRCRKLEYFAGPTEKEGFPLLTVYRHLSGNLRVVEADGWRDHTRPDHVEILLSMISELRAASGNNAKKRWEELEDMSAGIVRLGGETDEGRQ
jgi:hypothetical protein